MITPSDGTEARFNEVLVNIARRADALAVQRGRPGSLNLECWLLAEAEVLSRLPSDLRAPAAAALRPAA